MQPNRVLNVSIALVIWTFLSASAVAQQASEPRNARANILTARSGSNLIALFLSALMPKRQSQLPRLLT